MYEVQVAAARVNKYASRESGDTLEIVERPGVPGGISAILVDGQGSGRSAKSISNLVTSKALSLIKDGVRDDAAARAASDYLFTYRHGQVSATLNIISADLLTGMLVLTANSPVPSYVIQRIPGSEPVLTRLEESPIPTGIYARTSPGIAEFPLEDGLWAVSCTDGILNAGNRHNEKIDLENAILYITGEENVKAQKCADFLLELAIRHDRQRPSDDMSVVVFHIRQQPGEEGEPLSRRLSVSIPFNLINT
jgi:serine phosphatase RsbU (regulator of sigma subunit)